MERLFLSGLPGCCVYRINGPSDQQRNHRHGRQFIADCIGHGGCQAHQHVYKAGNQQYQRTVSFLFPQEKCQHYQNPGIQSRSTQILDQRQPHTEEPDLQQKLRCLNGECMMNSLLLRIFRILQLDPGLYVLFHRCQIAIALVDKCRHIASRMFEKHLHPYFHVGPQVSASI